MRITEVETFNVFAPGSNPPFRWRNGLRGSPPDTEVGVIRLRTDEGVDGVAIAPRRGAGPIVADAFEHAGSGDRAKLTAALATSTFASPIMPYGPTKFVNGQNEGAAPANTQVLDNDIKVILPPEFANAKAVFPIPA